MDSNQNLQKKSKTFIFQGMCYSGKSTLGKMVADTLGVPFLDSRDLFFKIYGVSEIEYLEKYGREKFIQAEKESLHQEFKGVFSCGGSVIYYPKEMEILNKNYNIIWLDVDFNLIEKRKNSEGFNRPIVYPDGINSFKELYEQRSKLYPKYSKYRIIVKEEESIKVTTQKIIRMLVN